MLCRFALIVVLLSVWCYPNSHALLYPREGPMRQVKRLDGVWNFKLAPINNPDQGFVDAWHSDAWNKVCVSWRLLFSYFSSMNLVVVCKLMKS